MDQIFRDETFDKRDFKEDHLPKGEYEKCLFTNCDFSGTDLAEIIFWECEFRSCNLSLAKLTKTAFREVKFINCKMLGLHFNDCNKFARAFSFEHCLLHHSSFYQAKIKGTIFKNTQLLEADFAQCDLSGAVFEHCDFTGATFDNTILEKADLRSSFNYSIDPAMNKIKKAKFSLSGISGLLDKYDIEITP